MRNRKLDWPLVGTIVTLAGSVLFILWILEASTH